MLYIICDTKFITHRSGALRRIFFRNIVCWRLVNFNYTYHRNIDVCYTKLLLKGTWIRKLEAWQIEVPINVWSSSVEKIEYIDTLHLPYFISSSLHPWVNVNQFFLSIYLLKECIFKGKINSIYSELKILKEYNKCETFEENKFSTFAEGVNHSLLGDRFR